MRSKCERAIEIEEEARNALKFFKDWVAEVKDLEGQDIYEEFWDIFRSLEDSLTPLEEGEEYTAKVKAEQFYGMK